MRKAFTHWLWIPPNVFSHVACIVVLSGCTGIQSALDPAGEEALAVARLFWAMAIAFSIIWAGVMLLMLYASRWKQRPASDRAAGRLVLWAGAVFPVAVLTLLLSYALWLMPGLRPFQHPEAAGLRIDITGHQFWWHVVYHLADGSQAISANEVRLPQGQRVELTLRSADMIHSFWIPALGGKMDLIPGRTNRLSLLATKPGLYRGQCAEFCGIAHAMMAFPAVVMEPADFDTWLAARGRPSPGIRGDHAGAHHFRNWQCGECHRIAGTEARGTAGPDLSHVGSRLAIGAGLFVNNEDSIARFVSHSPFLKPGSRMPAYSGLSDREHAELAEWLKMLQ